MTRVHCKASDSRSVLARGTELRLWIGNIFTTFGVLLGCFLASSSLHAEPVGGPTPEDRLIAREEAVGQQFRELEKSLLRLADLLASSDPKRSTLLRKVFERARDLGLEDRLDLIVTQLKDGQLLKAGVSQALSLEELRQLLDLLESGDAQKRLINTKEEVKQYLSKLNKLISRQREVEGETESGADEKRLSDRQDSLANDTEGLSREIGSFAQRLESREGSEKAGAQPPAKAKADENDDASRDDSEPKTENSGNDKDKKSDSSGESDKKEKSGTEKSDDTQKSSAGKNSEEAESKPSEGDPSEGSPSSPKPSESSESPQGESGASESAPQSEPQGDDEASRAQRTRKRLKSAEERMREARKKLDDAKRRDAGQEQQKALEELETARAELEEILRQLREEEVERLLVQLETRLRGMLRIQKAVLAATEKIASDESRLADRETQIEASRISRDQTTVANDAERALAMVRDDGSAVAIAEAIEQVRDDARQVAARLSRTDVGATTQGIQRDIVTGLQEMLSALEKAQRDQQASEKGQSGGRPAEPGEQPLVDKLSELKMIRSLQMRVNTRTKRFSKLLADGKERAEEPELLDALDRLSQRQEKIQQATRDIVVGRTE
ncbi:MAG: hypothetical protein WCR23_01330 [Planctomycetota bacterium]|jgi:hypothetical protein|nr:hypothetical protein [Pirellulales bacterium]TSA06097.1 MAG: hypothetical protein D4R77_06795 [Planctomycetaceae bacterium]